jgi:hypothetical protein
MDVATSPPFVFGADVFFVNGVPIVDASVPGSPAPRAILDFRNFRDDNGTGIAVDGSYVYLTASRGIVENGVSEDTRLYIGQYRIQEDLNGNPPTVSIASPAPGTTFVEGETIPVTVQANDDVGVAGVSLSVNGKTVGADAAQLHPAHGAGSRGHSPNGGVGNTSHGGFRRSCPVRPCGGSGDGADTACEDCRRRRKSDPSSSAGR